MSMHPYRRSAAARAPRGVTLIELLVGMAIGLMAVLVISQVMLNVEGQRRTTTSGADAQLTGSMLIYTLQREIAMAGYGLGTSQPGLGCVVNSLNFTAANGQGTAARRLAPVVITDGASGAPDTIRIYSTLKTSYSVPTLVTGNHPRVGVGTGVEEFVVHNMIGVQTGDLMMAVPEVPDAANTCTVFRATGSGSTPNQSIVHASLLASDAQRWNGVTPADLLAIFPAAGYPAGSYLINLGAGLLDRTYRVSSGTLQMLEFNQTTLVQDTSTLFPQVVNLQAFYGKDTDGNGSIDVYDTVQPATPAAWSQIIAIRVAVVVRSDQFESTDVTPASLVWDLGASPPVTGSVASFGSCSGQCLELKVNTDITSNDWKRYRYKVYDTVIPLRNVLWKS